MRIGPKTSAGSLRPMDIPEIDVVELSDRRDEGAVIIDVREDDEWLEARVPGAVHIPLGQVVERIDEVPTTGTVYVICGSGPRSARAVEHYRSVGVDAVNVVGGTVAWIGEGLPVDSGPGGL
jgi:rhodanese-related sulfurtransferase